MYSQLDAAFPVLTDVLLKRKGEVVEQEQELEKKRVQDLIAAVLNEDVMKEEYEWCWNDVCRSDSGAMGDELVEEIWDEVSEDVMKEVNKKTKFK
jgi:hypothetical protein